MLDSRVFFRRFARLYDTLLEDRNSEIGLYRRSYEGHKRTYDAWTHAMAVFLARLAEEFGLYQYSKRIDFKWNATANPHEPPVVAIEHENDCDGVHVEVEKLLKPRGGKSGGGTRAPLKVLVTYVKTRTHGRKTTAEDCISEVKSRALKKAESTCDFATMKGDFLLVIGDELTISVTWRAFSLDWEKHRWIELQ